MDTLPSLLTVKQPRLSDMPYTTASALTRHLCRAQNYTPKRKFRATHHISSHHQLDLHITFFMPCICGIDLQTTVRSRFRRCLFSVILLNPRFLPWSCLGGWVACNSAVCWSDLLLHSPEYSSARQHISDGCSFLGILL